MHRFLLTFLLATSASAQSPLSDAEAGVGAGGDLYPDTRGPPGSGGETYIGMMRENVDTIVRALKE